jgi:S1-C subfamily serine protease
MKYLLFFVIFASVASPISADRRISEEALIFRRLKGGVCTVYGDDGQGSGFLVDSLGIILTNDHVVGGASRIRVKFDDSTRVQAVFLTSDDKKDVAAIRVNPGVVAGYPVLPLASASDSMVFEGEKVIAIGSPLNQEKIMTTGIVSKVEPTALITDVNINHGNSGGPLLNMDGEVLAINTFGDFSTQGGPGVSGSVMITQAVAVLGRARSAMDSVAVPEARRLPIASRIPFPVDSLRAVAEFEKFERGPYEVSNRVSTGKFNVVVVTPVYDAWRGWRSNVELAKSTKKREQKGGLQAAQTYDPMRQMRDWMRYAGNDYAPVVTIQMAPKMGQTTGSLFANILGAAGAGLSGNSYYRGSHRYEYKADFLRAEITRDSIAVEDLNVFRAMIPSVFATADWQGDYTMEDQARTGIFQCDPSVFAPVEADTSLPATVARGDRQQAGMRQVRSDSENKDHGGKEETFPTIHIKIWSVEKPNKPYEFDLPRATVKRVWSDFGAWRAVAGLAGPKD